MIFMNNFIKWCESTRLLEIFISTINSVAHIFILGAIIYYSVIQV